MFPMFRRLKMFDDFLDIKSEDVKAFVLIENPNFICCYELRRTHWNENFYQTVHR